jgi:hypothetical protein
MPSGGGSGVFSGTDTTACQTAEGQTDTISGTITFDLSGVGDWTITYASVLYTVRQFPCSFMWGTVKLELTTPASTYDYFQDFNAPSWAVETLDIIDPDWVYDNRGGSASIGTAEATLTAITKVNPVALASRIVGGIGATLTYQYTTDPPPPPPPDDEDPPPPPPGHPSSLGVALAAHSVGLLVAYRSGTDLKSQAGNAKASSWASALTIATGVASDTVPSLAVARNDDVYCGYHDSGGGVVIKPTRDYGATWGSAIATSPALTGKFPRLWITAERQYVAFHLCHWALPGTAGLV